MNKGSNLKLFRFDVFYQKYGDYLHFYCWAEDTNHALEQFEDYEPKGEMIYVTDC